MNTQIIPSWLDTNEYPFESKYIDLRNGKMHYIDEGNGQVILFVHGTPTWSFLYRNFVKSLSKSYRCIAVDNIGFGLSDKPIDFDGTPKSHSENLSEFIQALDLNNIILVVHDFGGPIGLASAIANHSRISIIIMFNTWLWETKTNKDVVKIDKLINSFIGKFLYFRMNFSPKVLLKKGFNDKSKLTKQIHSQYLSPFPNSESRKSLYSLAKSLLGSSDWYQEQWKKIGILEDKKLLIIWGMKDTFLTPDFLEKWITKFPKATTKELDSGHFIQEEGFSESLNSIEEFLKS